MKTTVTAGTVTLQPNERELRIITEALKLYVDEENAFGQRMIAARCHAHAALAADNVSIANAMLDDLPT